MAKPTLPDDVVGFYAQSPAEHNFSSQTGVSPTFKNYECGACGKSASGRVVCELRRIGSASTVFWCVCSCEKREPSIMVTHHRTNETTQIPVAREFHCGQNWPPELGKLYEEASIAYAAGAFTATGMVVRKLLMACACHEGDTDGKKFVDYVDYITNNALTFPKARTSIDQIRSIGNEANHKLEFLDQDAAKRAMRIMEYMLNALYSLPSA